MTDKIHCAVEKATPVHSGYMSAEDLMKNKLKTKNNIKTRHFYTMSCTYAVQGKLQLSR